MCPKGQFLGKSWWSGFSSKLISEILYALLLMAQRVKHLPAVQETPVQSLGQEDPLEKEMATHSSTLAWKIPWMEKPIDYSLWGRKELELLSDFTFHFL